jgi:hypothetical protein
VTEDTTARHEQESRTRGDLDEGVGVGLEWEAEGIIR